MALQIRFSALESTGIILVCTKDLAAASLNEISNKCRDVRKKISNIVTSPVLDCRGDSPARVAESNVADTPNMGNKHTAVARA